MIALLVGVFFLAVALAKIVRGDLPAYLESSAMFPPGWGTPVASGLICLELVLAILLIWSGGRRVGWTLTAGVCAAFAVFHAFGAALGFAQSCNCTGVLLTHDARLSHILMGCLCLGLVLLALRMAAPRGAIRA